MKKTRETSMETGVVKGLYSDMSIQIIPTLGPKVCEHHLHWAISSLGNLENLASKPQKLENLS